MQETVKLIDDPVRKAKIQKAIEEGYTTKCLGCGRITKGAPTVFMEDGHGGHDHDMCKCGSDLFESLHDLLKDCRIMKIEPVLIEGRKTLIFKESNFKYCRCHKGELWCGDAEFECHSIWSNSYTNPTRLDDTHTRITCPKSGLDIIVIRDDIVRKDEKGYWRTPFSEEDWTRPLHDKTAFTEKHWKK